VVELVLEPVFSIIWGGGGGGAGPRGTAKITGRDETAICSLSRAAKVWGRRPCAGWLAYAVRHVFKVMKLMESTKDEGNKSVITTDSERSDQGRRNGCLDCCPLSSYGQARRYLSPSN